MKLKTRNNDRMNPVDVAVFATHPSRVNELQPKENGHAARSDYRVVEKAGETTTTNYATTHHITGVVRPIIEAIIMAAEVATAIEVGEADEMNVTIAAGKATRNTHVQTRKTSGGENQETILQQESGHRSRTKQLICLSVISMFHRLKNN